MTASADFQIKLDRLLREAKEQYGAGKTGAAVLRCVEASAHIRSVRGESETAAAQLNGLGLYFKKNYANALAEVFYLDALRLRRAHAPQPGEKVAISVANLAMLYAQMGRADQAEPLFREALDISGDVHGRESPRYAAKLDQFGQFLTRQGRFADAQPYLDEALAVARKHAEALPLKHAQALNNLANLNYHRGDLRAAESGYARALEIGINHTGEHDRFVAPYYSNLAVVYRALSRNDEALAKYQTAERIYRSSRPLDYKRLANCLHNTGELLKTFGRYADSHRYLREAHAIRRDVLRNRGEVGSTVRALADLAHLQKQYADALRLYTSALETFEQMFGEGDSRCADVRNSLAGLSLDQGHWEVARQQFQVALEARVAALGDKHIDVAQSLGGLARACAAQQDYLQAISHLQRAAAIYDARIDQVVGMSSGRERLGYLNSIRRNTDFLMSLLVVERPPAEFLRIGLNFVLRRKGLDIEASAMQLAALKTRGDADADHARWVRASGAHSRAIGAGSPTDSGDARRQTEADVQDAERAMARRLSPMALADSLRAATIDTVLGAASLPADAALVECVYFRMMNFTALASQSQSLYGQPQYAAFIVEAAKPHSLALVKLGDAERIDEAVAGWRRAIVSDRRRGHTYRDVLPFEPAVRSDADKRLTEMVFEPIRQSIGHCRRLVVCPDAELTQLPLQALPLGSDRYVIDEYTISYMNTLRDALRPRVAFADPKQPLVVAAPDYDSSGDGQEPADATAVAAAEARDLRDVGFPFAPLAGSRREGREVAKLLGVEALVEQRATEQNLKAGCPPRILHIATHGFFRENQADTAELSGRLGALDTLDDPLLRCALVLAGGNVWNRRGVLPSASEDGILYGQDIASLELSPTELVVLSACDTGVGEVRRGQGVFGLRSAVRLAGARTLVMSLWKIADDETASLMTEFYRRLIGGEARAEALRQAQLAIKTQHANPIYWGAFICEGDDGPLTEVV